MTSITLHMRINENSGFIPVLSIPVDECNRFALRPLKWLRFLGYTIYGRIGHISAAPHGPPMDYQLAIEGGAHYYFISSGPPRLLDNQCINDRISSIAESAGRAGFRAGLNNRDHTCIVSNAPNRLCEGAHILPHSKGSEYLTQFMIFRKGSPDVDDINDIRNGLLLSRCLHALFGLGEIAFLWTPNFALEDTDVPRSPGPISGQPSTGTSVGHGRFITQHFKRQGDYVTQIAPHNQDARFPADRSQFAHPTIVDAFYGCAALLRWGIRQATDTIESSVRSSYYNGSNGNLNLGDLSGGNKNGKDDPTATWRSERVRSRRHNQQSGINTVGEALDLMLLLWSQSAPGQDEPPAIQMEDLGQKRVHEWLQTQ